MFKNYFKTAWRNLNKHRLFSVINIFGLATGIAVCLLAIMQIRKAFAYDNFHPDASRTYRILTDITYKNGEQFLCATSPAPLSGYLKTNYSGVEDVTSIQLANANVVANEKRLYTKLAYIQPGFYSIFGFKVLEGAPALQPQTATLSYETAKRFFNEENPVGKVLVIDSNNYIINGVLAKNPGESHLNFDILVSPPAGFFQKSWDDETIALTYVKLKKGISTLTFKNMLNNAAKDANDFIHQDKKTFAFNMQRLDHISPGTINLYNRITDEPLMSGLIIFACISLGILMLAFFNYINLTLARSLGRSKEVGIRKVTGALKKHIIFQFLSEAVLTAFLALCIAMIELTWISRFSTVQRMVGTISYDAITCISFVMFTFITGILAGWIPAKIFSKVKIVKVLSGRFNIGLFGGIGLRKTLIAIQFTVSMVAVITLMIFYKQCLFMANADYGFNRQNILTLPLPENGYKKAVAAFSLLPGVQSISATSQLFGFSGGDAVFIRKSVNDSVRSEYFSISPSVITDFGLQIIAGKTLPPVGGHIFKDVLINEEACKILNFTTPGDAVGKIIKTDDTAGFHIAGVVRNFHYAGMQRSIMPLILTDNADQFTRLNLKIQGAADQYSLKTIKNTWEKTFPNEAFDALWFDQLLHDQHLHEGDLSGMGVLTGMSLSIALLGLLGMVVYTTQTRSKEVSIRKIMGASVTSIILQVSKSFTYLLLIAVAIGLPVGILLGNQFLNTYAFHIRIDSFLIIAAIIIFLLPGLCTIGWYTYRIAVANPVESLRTE
ncbi:FtsX-like permease family protein [Parafilimonas sp.]|uniref:FtsX-like permease family protein n=1 Tax=Parafilimonas sp. TaxID=1969739 RepID=UPI0039E6DF9F